jgi:flagellar hook-associated protein 1 FlgK
MSGLGLILSIARDALAAQQYGINVTGHNIANVNTEGYSRQTSVNEAREPAPYGGLLLGRGVDVTQVLRASDQFIESQLMDRKSDMSTSQELENYMQVVEGLFNENSEASISMMMSKFWNLCQDIANNPSGSTERVALYEHSILMSDQFKTLNTDLTQIQTDLTRALSAGIVQINEITNEIAQVNGQLVGMEAATSIANDLRDKRNTLTSELAQYIDVKTFEQTNGSLTIITAKGCVLVHGNDNYNLVPGGDNGDRIMWGGKDGVATGDITNNITRGKMGGWLEMRDEIVEKYKLDLNAMTEEFIWAVNQQHSQGVGLEAFSAVTGTYAASDAGKALGTKESGLNYYDKISDGTFNLWVYDSNGNLDTGEPSVIIVDADIDGTKLTDLRDAIDGANGNISASIVGGKLKIDVDTAGYTFAFSDDNSNVLAALGVNSFFTGTGAGGIGINDKISLDKNYIAAAQVYNNVGPSVPASDNSSTGTITTTGPYTGEADATYNIKIVDAGNETDAEFQWSTDGVNWSSNIELDDGNGVTRTLNNGVSVTFNAGDYVLNDTFTIAATKSSGTYGTFASGNNTNALAIADLQYTSIDISQWTCDRIDGNKKGSLTATIDSYYYSMISSIGIKSSSISRNRAFNAVMANKIGEIRNSISAVSLDEEMANIIKFQRAFQAAAKLISISDEMLNTLLSVK